ncbi:MULTISPECIES: PTS sugar transporter subunit IIB [unclassified Bacillus (in: firmicutes)]|uniref:PTS sugar transporter subunit IIB n=1 Tax=unclassified Bacillus (in: firmicutes) TaxID=185979 RepID=UPI001BE85644|nr:MULTISPECIES: PTS sugar transporter subunit IIB [unclassified Bacillus (in: firmicutes)]MBT2618033.1 PTS sugar transporter subunit IIB [Bacillus sp. ISL-78]MBT2630106.1 PTS sugar transporter subunit IIB [Bacillus sp. ISL-101]
MNILLCCSAGMSTSLLVNKMEKAAVEEGLSVKIQAVATMEVRNHINEVDVILLGPQVRYQLNDIKKIGNEKGIPVDTINPMHYGTCNGKEVLRTALQLISK